MNKNEFLFQLEGALLRLSKSDRDDILLDYEEHFRAGAEKGMSEEDVSASLGEPSIIAAQYLENLPADAKGAPAQMPESEEVTAIALPALTDGNEETEQTANAPAYTKENATNENTAQPAAQHISGGRKFANVVFWIAAVCTIIALVYVWVGMLCATIGFFMAAAALIGCSFIFVTENILLFIGMLLIGAGLICLAVLFINALKYSMRGLKKLIGVFKNTSNKIMGRV